jgi:ferredoxin
LRAGGLEVGTLDLAKFPHHGFSPDRDTLYGFLFPVYAYGPPKIVWKFLKGLPRAKDVEAFVYANAGEEAGVTLPIAKRFLKRKGWRIAGADYCYMPQNFSPIFEVPPDGVCAAMIAEAERAAAEFAGKLAEGGESIVRNGPGLLARSLGLVYWIFRVFGTRNFFKIARIDDTCNGCGLCAKICPKGNIVMREDRPVIGRNCEMCIRCLSYCPKQSIQAFSSGRHGRYKRMPFL